MILSGCYYKSSIYQGVHITYFNYIVLKWTIKVENGWKKVVRQAFRYCKHLKAGRNTLQLSLAMG